MGWWLATQDDRQAFDVIKRFDPLYWTVDFPRPMMAALTTAAPGMMRVDAVFLRHCDLAGLIWDSVDRWDHPLLSYDTVRDYRGCRLRFRWRSDGVKPLDAIDGPTLTIEGRDAGGVARSWYVRLWNYATGDPDDAVVAIDFDALDGGFLLPGEADPVWAGDIDRMFVSLVAPAYAAADTGPLPAPVEGWVELSEMACSGGRSSLRIGDAMLPAHGVRIAGGYDDSYNVAPARLLRNMLALGYRGSVDHYVGMSHHFALGWDAGAAAYLPTGGLCGPARSWHQDFMSRSKALGYDIILSISYELLDMHCPAAWKQRAEDGAAGLTGWDPPSALLSPAHAGAMAWLQGVARAFAGMARDAGVSVRVQVGEPWWWVMADGRPCLYDAAAVSAFGGSPPSIPDVRGALDAGQTALLDAAGALLAGSTAALADAVRDEVSEAELLLLVYLPSAMDPAAPDLRRANVPLAWAWPAFDRLQLEDYDWVTGGRAGAAAKARDAVTARLGYPTEDQHYFSGFVTEADSISQWQAVADAAAAARRRGVAETFVWALPQVIRDGFVTFDLGEEEDGMQAFDEADFPLAIGMRAEVEAGFSTRIVASAAGHEQRSTEWADARMRYDAGPGIRSESDIALLVDFFRARRGAARGFRFRDPFDHGSRGPDEAPTPIDQYLGTGDDATERFQLVKRYGAGEAALVRPVRHPVAGSVRIARDGVEAVSGWSLDDAGGVVFETPPATGVDLRAGFLFDVPVRFAEDRLAVSAATFGAGAAVSVPLVELREG